MPRGPDAAPRPDVVSQSPRLFGRKIYQYVWRGTTNCTKNGHSWPPGDAKPTFFLPRVRRHEDQNKYRMVMHVSNSAVAKRGLHIHDSGTRPPLGPWLDPLIRARLAWPGPLKGITNVIQLFSPIATRQQNLRHSVFNSFKIDASQ